MKLEKYIKKTGAFLRPVYKEVTEELSYQKGNRDSTVEQIVVSVMLESGITYSFQGDELSQGRLVRAGWTMEKTGATTIPWKTLDNLIVELTVTDIANILLAAGLEQTAIWFN